MITEPELLNERLERLAMVLDEIMPNCASLVRDALELLKEQEEEIENLKQTAQSMMEGICLLKEQEAVKPIRKLAYTKQGWFCGNCDNRLNRNGKYCSFCGKPILWEGR